MQDVDLTILLNLPATHLRQEASSADDVPSEKIFPTGHVVTDLPLHAVASSELLKVPALHGEQVESVVEEPDLNPLPASHFV